MCAGSKSSIGKDNVSMYIGYFGGEIVVGDVSYGTTAEANHDADDMRRKLNSYKKSELIELMLELVENADE